MTLNVLPDVVHLVRVGLVTVPEVVALVGQRVTTRSPRTLTYPYVTLGRSGGVPVDRDRLDRALIDVNAWGGPLTGVDTEGLAHDVARVVRAAIHSLEGFTHDDGVITGVEDVLSGQWLPDTVATPPVARVVFTVGVYAHP